MPEDTVTIRLQGGLGNQMFGAAAALALARRLDARLVFDLGSFPSDPKRGYELAPFGIEAGLIEAGTPRTGGVLQRLMPGRAGVVRHWRERHFHYDESFEDLTGSVHLSGYLQSPRYFRDAAAHVRHAFDLAPLVTPAGREIAGQARAAGERAIAVHIRRGDYLSDPKAAAVHNSVDSGYYARALGLLTRMVPDAAIFVVSDEPAAVPEVLGERARDAFVCAGNSAFDDMYLISACRHRIIANSSFSWWGAWLASHEAGNDPSAGVTIAPRNWFTREKLLTTATCDLLPAHWVLM